MLRYKDFESEINNLKKKVDDGSVSVGDLVKGFELIGKFLRDVRSNQVRIMKATNAEIRTGKPETTEKKTEKSETKTTEKE